MGQYHKLINLDKKEFVDPHKLGLGLKQVEHSFTEGSLGDAIYILLSLDNGKGGGDLNTPWFTDYGFFGKWVGDHIAVIGDYNNTDIFEHPNGKAYSYKVAYDKSHEHDQKFCENHCPWHKSEHWKDITDEIIKVFHENASFWIEKQDKHETTWRKRVSKVIK